MSRDDEAPPEAHGESLADLFDDRAIDEIPEDLETGDQVGAYRLIERVGKGGMGAVWSAERIDGQFDQRVAIKVIHRGMNSNQVVARFRRERQILARLEHPLIARLLDGGVLPDGRPYFVMEFVAGEPINVHCDRLRLQVDERLRLFADVCRAVRYAHSKLIVHRDLKPANILVTGAGEVRLLDFGIAKLLTEEEATVLTRADQRVMTPAYAAPEQLAGEEITTATDVYTLGAILYELLTGIRPIDPEELDSDPVKPSSRVTSDEIDRHRIAQARRTETGKLRRRISGDLDVICLKALRREPERRYASVEALLDDLERHAAGLPLRARPDSPGYRMRKAIVRHRVAILATAAVVAAIGAVIAFYTARLADERDLARVEAAKATQVATFLEEIFEISDPDQSGGEEITARELLDAGARRMEQGLADQPEVQARMYRVIGNVYHALGPSDRALELLERSLRRSIELHGPEHEEVAVSRHDLGVMLHDHGKLEEAERELRAALASIERIFGDQSVESVGALNNLAHLLDTRADYEGAERLYRESLRRARAETTVASTQVKLGRLLRRMARYDEAERLFREALTAQRRFGGRDLAVASTMRNLAAVLRDTGEHEESERLFREVLQTRRRILGDRHPSVAATLNSYGVLLSNMGRHEQAAEAFAEMLAIHERTYRDGHPSLAAAYHNVASSYRDAGDHERAAEHYRKSIETNRRVHGEGHPDRAYPLVGLGSMLVDLGRAAEAEPLLSKALELRRAALPEPHRHTGEALYNLGRCMTALGRYGEAQRLLDEALRVLTEAEGSDAGRTRMTREALQELAEARGS